MDEGDPKKIISIRTLNHFAVWNLPIQGLNSDCENYRCSNKYFKCSNYYCVPWNKVCNGIWDCPRGVEERLCNRTNCPGQYKCQNTSICLALEDICDTETDCLLQDDEIFCHYKLPSCPNKCTCLLFMISCEYLVSYHLNWYCLTKRKVDTSQICQDILHQDYKMFIILRKSVYNVTYQPDCHHQH